MAKIVATGSDGSDNGKLFKFPISKGLNALCRGLAYNTGTDIGKIYSGGVIMAVEKGETPDSAHLGSYLRQKYGNEVAEIEDDLEVN